MWVWFFSLTAKWKTFKMCEELRIDVIELQNKAATAEKKLETMQYHLAIACCFAVGMLVRILF